MNKVLSYLIITLISFVSFAQEEKVKNEKAHYNTNKFKQLKEEFNTPNTYRTASGAPGKDYFQQQVDYKMDIILDDKNQKIFGNQTITYHNNSPDALAYLWIQLDQNVRAADSKTPDIEGGGPSVFYKPEQFTQKFLGKPFDGGFKIEYVKDINNNDLDYVINQTMMRLDLPKPLQAGETTVFKMKWWYNIPEHTVNRSRSGYEHFEKDGNNNYIIAQFFPRLAVYNNVEGWQNLQFWGRGEFALEFGNYHVNITTPSDHILDATGKLLNRKKMLTKVEYKRFEKAMKSFDKPIIIVTQEEVIEKEKHFSDKTKTWKFYAENVRDFAFASSRKYILDIMAVKIGNKTVIAESMYPKEGNPLWEEHSTRVVANTLESYSKQLFDYPYHKAISVHGKQQGMEYPMICWNYGRPREDGTYSERTKNGMIGVITHEVGHNWFPMIVNSDERQWTWMDEGLNSYTEIMAEQTYQKGFPSRSFPKNVTEYMRGDQDQLSPIMSQSNNIYNFGMNAYAKPAAGLYILREVILGHELFDKAFSTYAKRWKFKHPTPEDFFRTMEDASATDLDWFWRGWFYTTGNVDVGIKGIKKYVVTTKPTTRVKKMAAAYGMKPKDFGPVIYLVDTESEDYTVGMENIKNPIEDIQFLKDYLANNFKGAEHANLKNTRYFYEIIFEKPGDIPMPIIVDYIFTDGTKMRKQYPAQIWRKNDKEVKKLFASDKEIKEINIDPDQLTADVNIENNYWPKKVEETKIEKFKKKLKDK
ncbi:MAG: M1 family metallopeptidase [Flavobacteriaceae bacterium]|nr:M1 family metallopeptidase [Flavobacteriaceae bacterium]